jgi:hypothetical protein
VQADNYLAGRLIFCFSISVDRILKLRRILLIALVMDKGKMKEKIEEFCFLGYIAV